MSDVLIIGAGPAGLALGCYLARADVPCTIVEKLHHPRPHVGESLMPASIRVFREIEFLPVMEAAGFPRSGGTVYHAPGSEPIEVAYAEFPQEGVEQAHTYHVDRSKFDLLLLKHAESLGCEIIQGVGVEEVAFDDAGRACGVRASLGSRRFDFPARVVVDASGRSTRIGRQLGLRRDHPHLDQMALHAWFYDVDRGPRKGEQYTHMYFLPELRGWAWQAPIDGEITSVGLVVARTAFRDSGLGPGDFFVEAMKRNRELSRATELAVQVTDLRGEANYSYRLEEACGDGWLAVGDAARFLDPVFGSGVSAAIHSSRAAHSQIMSALELGDPSREAFLRYENGLFADVALWDEFITLFYRLLPAFVDVLRSSSHRLSALRLIQGDPDAAADLGALTEMRRLVLTVEGAEGHPLRRDLMPIPPRL